MSNLVMKKCRRCKKFTKHTQPSTSHLLHLILSFLTAGVWVLVWIIVALNNKSAAQCMECGKTKGVLG